ncbi:protein NLP7-like [Lycium ferocissimum]|uniref:protein NLP7-like n=1 Tax=Lycium ferocissimum TaxID=112874 RepID=UPI0028155924|nr:protein NLP7-like [Lycium ferocissimum]
MSKRVRRDGGSSSSDGFMEETFVNETLNLVYFESSLLDPAAAPVSSSTMGKQRIISTIVKMWSCTTSLVQFWAPIKVNGSTVLSTADQPFAFHKELDKRLFEYRRLCLDTLIPIDMYNEDLLGSPGRVFRSGLPEVNPDVGSYSAGEFPLLETAIRLGICSYYAISVFNLHDHQCVGVFEMASTQPFLFIPVTIEDMDLKSSGLYSICYSTDTIVRSLEDDSGIDQIEAGLHVVRKIHSLPFAQIWIPYSQSGLRAGASSYDRSRSMYREFEYASKVCFIPSGKGLVGRAFPSQGSCFCKDVTLLSLTEYPMVPGARKARLNQCFAICLRSNSASNIISAVVEFFLPPDEMVVRDTKTFLNLLLSTMKEQLPGVRVASGEELGQRIRVEVVKVSPSDELDSFEIGQPLPIVQSLQDGGETAEIVSLCQQSNLQNEENNDLFIFLPSCSSHKRDSLNCERPVQVDPLLPHPTPEAGTNRGTVNVDVAHDDHIEFEKDTGQMMQPDSHFEQPSVEIDSTGNAMSNDKLEHNDIARCLPVVEAEATNEDSNVISGATTNNEKIHSQKNNEIQRIEKNYQITRDILEQQFGSTLENAAKNLRVSRATLKRICREYAISRWPHHKTRKVYHNFSQGISLQGAEPYMGDQQCPNLSQEKGTNCSVHKKSRSTGKPCDDSVMSIKVTYRDDIIKFTLTPSSTMVEPEGGVEKRLNISLQIFPIKYQDEDEDWVTITGDSDLREGMHEIRLLGRTAMKLVVTPKSDT